MKPNFYLEYTNYLIPTFIWIFFFSLSSTFSRYIMTSLSRPNKLIPNLTSIPLAWPIRTIYIIAKSNIYHAPRRGSFIKSWKKPLHQDMSVLLWSTNYSLKNLRIQEWSLRINILQSNIIKNIFTMKRNKI
jgi:hypothetical protein